MRYKYLHKGTDKATITILESGNEIKLRKHGRVMTAHEAHYLYAGFKRHDLQPKATKLSYHIPGECWIKYLDSIMKNICR